MSARAERLFVVSLGQRVRFLRRVRRLTTREFATRAGMAPSTVNSIELGVRVPSAVVLLRLTAALQVPWVALTERADTADTKSRNGRRAIGLPAELATLLQHHRAEQDREREAAAQLWEDNGWVFTTPTGRPLNPRTDFTNWKKLLTAAGVREGRLHDARHTAATVLLVLGVPQRAVMDLMGWANTDMARRYQHLTDEVRADIAERVGSLLWHADVDETRGNPLWDWGGGDQRP